MVGEITLNNMAKVYDEPIDKHTDWGGDASTGFLPVSGERVQEFIKTTLESKAGCWYYDPTNNRYLVFADSENRDLYLDDPSRTDLIIATFDAPFNYSAKIDLETPRYNAILEGTENVYVEFTFDTMDKNGASVGEGVIATYTFMKSGVKKVVTEKYRYGTRVRFKVDDYILPGTNTLQIGVQGENTLAATTVGVTFEVVNLRLSDNLDISKVYNKNNLTLEAPYTVSGYGTKVMEWYVDGVLLPFSKVEDEVVEISSSRTKYIDLSSLSHGVHSLQFRVYTVINGDRFHSGILYRDFALDLGTPTDPMVMIAIGIPAGIDPMLPPDFRLHGVVQYAPFSLRFAVYNPLNPASTPVVIKLDGTPLTTVNIPNGTEQTYALRVNDAGDHVLRLEAGATSRDLPFTSSTSPISVREITDGLVLSLQALGRTNSDANRDSWTHGDYSTTFTGFEWNDTSGWNDNRLIINKGAKVDVNISPLSVDVTERGYTMEFELSTEDIDNDDAIVIDLTSNDGTGALVTASEIKLTSSAGKSVSMRYRVGENIRFAFVIERKTGTVNRKMAFIYIDGVYAGGLNYGDLDNFISSKSLTIGNTQEAVIKVKAIRFYNAALNADQILNNFTLYRDTIDEMLDVYYRNDIYEENTTEFSMDALAGQLPVMLVTGNIPELEGTTDKKKTIIVDLQYTNLQDPSKSFTTKGTWMRPQGTSSMSYPKKNFRIYTSHGEMYDASGNRVQGGLYSFKDKAQPVDCFCFKADYAESSGTHNTGIARLWNDVMKNVQVNGEYVCRTQAQQAAIDNGYDYDVRTTVDGFPVVMFYRLTENDAPIFMGKYNFNNDKSTEKVFGFTDIPGFDNSKVECWECLNNGNHLALFEDVDNWDSEWTDAFEGRYPDGNEDTTALKRLATWLSSTKNDLEKFKREKRGYLDIYKVAAYYVYLMRFGAVDQTVKNAMLDTEDGIHWFFINYDNDTINGLRNDSLLVYLWNITRQSLDPTYSETVYAYAGHDSVLWNNVEADEEFMEAVKVIDNALYQAGLSYALVMDMFNVKQSDKWCERVYNQDSQYKYIGPFSNEGINNLYMMQGTRKSHRSWWLKRRFDMFDAMWVSGEYKSKQIELKVANAPIGLKFSITAGTDFDYGYGVNNVPVETGVSLQTGESHEFTTRQVLNVGDPVRIYGAMNVQGIDISAFAPYLSTLNVANVLDNIVGTKLEKIIAGNEASNNTSLYEIQGLSRAIKLKYLDIQGYKSLTSLDLTNQPRLETLLAFSSGLTSVLLANGAPVATLQLPDTLKALQMEDLPLLSTGLQIDGKGKALRNIKVLNCPKFDSLTFVKDWWSVREADLKSISLQVEGVNWTTTSDFIEGLCSISVAGGSLTLRGMIDLPEITQEQYNLFVSVFGDTVFNKGSELYIKIPPMMFLEGPGEVVEGKTGQYTARVVSDETGVIIYVLVNSSGTEVTSLTINNATVKIHTGTGLVTTTEGLSSDSSFTVRAKFRVGTEIRNMKDLTVRLVKVIYPNSTTTVTGPSILNKTGLYDYVITVKPDNVNASWGRVVSVDTELQNVVEIVDDGSVNGFKLRCTSVESIVTGNVQVKFTKESGAELFTKTIPLSVVVEGVIMTSKTNPKIMKICYNAGWCSSEEYMTETEAAAVTDLTNGGSDSVFSRVNLDNDFSAFQYFTGLVDLPEGAFSYAPGIKSIVIPPQVTTIPKNCFLYQYSALESVKCLGKVTRIMSYAFHYSKIESFDFSSVTYIGSNAFEGNTVLKSLNFEAPKITIESNAFNIYSSLGHGSLDGSLCNLENVSFAGSFIFQNNLSGSISIKLASLSTACFQSSRVSKVTFIDEGSPITSYPKAFAGCNLLEEIENWPASTVKEFYQLQTLQTFKVRDDIKLTSILGNAFANCPKLVNFVADLSALTAIGPSAFVDCSEFDADLPLDQLSKFYESSIKGTKLADRLETLSFNDNLVNYYADSQEGISLNLKAITVTDTNTRYKSTDDGWLYEISGSLKYLARVPPFKYKDPFSRVEEFSVSGYMFGSSVYPLAGIKANKLVVEGPVFESWSDLTSLPRLGSGNIFEEIEARNVQDIVAITNVSVKKITISNDTEDQTVTFCSYNTNLVELRCQIVDPAGLLSYCKALEYVEFSPRATRVELNGLLNLKTIKIYRSGSLEYLNFGDSETTYTGRNTYSTGENVLYAPSGATGYDTGKWVDTLLNADKCGFTISYTL